MEAAEALRGALLEIPEDETPAFAEGEYYIDQIEGCEVVSLAGDALGRVTEVLRPGANDVYVVRGASPRELLIPALRRPSSRSTWRRAGSRSIRRRATCRSTRCRRGRRIDPLGGA